MSKVQLQSRKIYWYLVVVFFLFSAGIGTGGYFFFGHQKKKLKEKDWEQLAAIADLKVGQIINWRKERIGDGSIIMETPFIHYHARQLLSGPASSEDKQAFLDWMALWQRTYSYQSIFLLDTRGTVRLSIPEGEGLPDSYSRALALEAMQGKKVLLTDLHRSETTQKIHIDLCVPFVGAGEPKNLPLAEGWTITRIGTNVYNLHVAGLADTDEEMKVMQDKIPAQIEILG